MLFWLWNTSTITTLHYSCIMCGKYSWCIWQSFSSISDIHQHDTWNATMKSLYVNFRGTTRGKKTSKYCGPRIWNFIIKNINLNCPISSFKKIIVNCFLPLEMMLCSHIHYQSQVVFYLSFCVCACVFSQLCTHYTPTMIYFFLFFFIFSFSSLLILHLFLAPLDIHLV